MACFLRIPQGNNKGVLVFTDYEHENIIRRSASLQSALADAKKHWLFGLHHNSPHAKENFVPFPLYDFHLAGKGDLKGESAPFRQIELDCSNFCPDFFVPRNELDNEKFWDLLFISRNILFKNLEDFFTIVRKIYDQRPLRVLAVIPHANLHEKGVGRSAAIDAYLRSFSETERRTFTMMTPSLDCPFPFDLETLAHFYHHSRSFLHVAHFERHPRVVAYAWAAGLPVIAPWQVSSLLPENLRQPPGFYAYENPEDAVNQIFKAISAPYSGEQKRPYLTFHTIGSMRGILRQRIQELLDDVAETTTEDAWLLYDLDIRLARHHLEPKTRNTLGITLADLVPFLRNPSFLESLKSSPDYEVSLAAKTVQGSQLRRAVNREINFQRVREVLRPANLWRELKGFAVSKAPRATRRIKKALRIDSKESGAAGRNGGRSAGQNGTPQKR